MAGRLCCVDSRFPKLCFTSGTESKLPVSIAHRAHAVPRRRPTTTTIILHSIQVAVEVQWDHISRVIVTLRRDQTIFDTGEQEVERAYEVRSVNPDAVLLFEIV